MSKLGANMFLIATTSNYLRFLAVFKNRSKVDEWPEANDESDTHIESNQRTSLAAFSSGTDRPGPEGQTLESPFEWVPSQLSRFLTDKAFRASGAILNYVFRRKPCKSQMGTISVPRANRC